MLCPQYELVYSEKEQLDEVQTLSDFKILNVGMLKELCM
jgi:hypothetical protein